MKRDTWAKTCDLPQDFFVYNDETDEVKAVDETEFDKFVDKKCGARQNREKGKDGIKNKMLDQVKQTERRRRGLSISSVASLALSESSHRTRHRSDDSDGGGDAQQSISKSDCYLTREMASANILTVGYINIRCQTGLPVSKQLQIEAFAMNNQCDILHLQEANIEDETFFSCSFLQSSFNIVENNATNKYGTASLVKTDLKIDNIRCDSEGRVIVFDLGDLTLGNIYLQSGTDAKSRAAREKYCCEVLPRLLINSKYSGCLGGDFNCIVDKKDATNYPESNMSKGLQRLIKLKGWHDSYRTLHPTSETFSRYYENSRAEGATRIDRNYHVGEVTVIAVKYLPLAFSDHFALVVKIYLPDLMARTISPKCRPSFKLKPEVIMDSLFQERLKDAMQSWERVKTFQGVDTDTLLWWEMLVKPGIKKIGIDRSKEINKEKREELNLLLLRQVYMVKKIQQGQMGRLGELMTVHLLIEKWYTRESDKIQHQSRVREFQESEKTSIYHHELHKKIIKKASILQLMTEDGLIEGHSACVTFLENTVGDLLLHP